MHPTALDPETRLFVRFRDDADIAALGELYDLSAAELLRVALHLVREPAGAEDLVQQTFLAAIESAPRFDEARRVRAWLLGILTNLAHKLQREEARVPQPASGAVADPVNLAAAAEFTEQVDAAIDTLPAVYQPVLVLHLKHGMAAAEIAHALRRPPGTVRTQLVRALELLKKALPASLAVSFGVLCLPMRGLAAVKQIVLANAGHQVAGAAGLAAGGAGIALTSLGGTLLVKKYLAAVVLVVLALSVPAVWLANEPRPPIALPKSDADTALAELPNSPPVQASEATDDANRREAAPAATTYGSLRYRFLWETDRTPAVGVFVHCMVWGRSNPFRGNIDVPTDTNGEIHLLGLEPGKVGLYVDRAEGATPDITAGTESSGTYLIPQGVTVDVAVQDEQGRGIPGARVWLSHYGNGYKGHEVGVTSGAGRLTIRDVGEGRQVAARADGYAPTGLFRVEGRPGDRINVRMTMLADAASLHGSVQTADGRPCTDACVWIGGHTSMPVDAPERGNGMPPPLEVHTDGNGRFFAVGLAVATVTVRGRAPGAGSTRQLVELRSGQPTEIAIELPVGAVIAGFVRDDEGKPIANARVFGGDSYGDFGYCSVHSAADGSFTLADLPPHRVDIIVNCEKFLPSRETLYLTAGERRALDFVLQRSKASDQIRGELVDERGQPLVGWIVSAPPPRGGVGWSAWLKTDKDGRFVGTGCTRPECTLEVYAADSKDYTHSVLIVRGVKRGGDPVRVVVPDAVCAVGGVTGRIVGVDGRPLRDAHVGIHTPGIDRYQQLTTDADGTFRAENLPVRTYDVEVRAKDHPQLSLGAIQLNAAKELDLGTIVLPHGGRVTIEAVGEARLGSRRLSATICTPTGQSIAYVDLAAKTISKPIAPGRYLVFVNGEGIAAASRACEVTDGATTTVQFDLVRGTRRSVELREAKANTWSSVDLAANDPQGQRVWNWRDFGRRDSSSQHFSISLGLGTWTIEAKTDTGLTGRTTVQVTDLDVEQGPIVLELR